MEPPDPLDVLDRVALVYRTLRSAEDAMSMLASAADGIRDATPVAACFVLRVAEASLTTHGTRPLRHPEGDALRRRTLAAPIPLAPGSLESEIVRRPAARDDPRVLGLPSLVAQTLGLDHARTCLMPVAPDARAVAIVVAVRDDRPMSDGDRRLLGSYVHAVTAALELVVLRMRAAELLSEVRQASSSIQALAREMTDAPVTLPVDQGFGLTFPTRDPLGTPAGFASDEVRARLTEREIRVAELLSEGMSNREIAASLVLSPETVKSHVSSILRKLDASNRAEAVSRLARMTAR
ncbi:MAG: helix-turn-helix transcriptional regulator [Solirubrobacteraceae bacterium]|nr:helix-turn-helix transcriptional regulator [Solirubrobacteraceae bacterium]